MMLDLLRAIGTLILAAVLGILVRTLRSFRVARKHGQWYVTDRRYHITGCGRTLRAARRDVSGLTAAYVRSCRADGMSDAEARAARH
jgi:sarcosine oxidase delta subunit